MGAAGRHPAEQALTQASKVVDHPEGARNANSTDPRHGVSLACRALDLMYADQRGQALLEHGSSGAAARYTGRGTSAGNGQMTDPLISENAGPDSSQGS